MRAHPFAAVAESPQVTVEPLRDVAAFAFHEVDFTVGDDELLKHDYLLVEAVDESCGIHHVVSVDECVFHPCSREVLYYRAAHCEFIQVVVGEVGDYRFHLSVDVTG